MQNYGRHLMLSVVASDAMPRTTLDLDASVLDELRRRAAREGKSMGALASELLIQSLARDNRPSEPEPLRWTSRDLGLPRVDLEDKEALRTLLDSSS
jgi:plasmid stability protein